ASSFRGAREDEAEALDDQGLEGRVSPDGLELRAGHERDGKGDGRRHLLAGLSGPRSPAARAPGCGHEGSVHISVAALSTHLEPPPPALERGTVEDPGSTDLVGPGNLAALRLPPGPGPRLLQLGRHLLEGARLRVGRG